MVRKENRNSFLFLIHMPCMCVNFALYLFKFENEMHIFEWLCEMKMAWFQNYACITCTCTSLSSAVNWISEFLYFGACINVRRKHLIDTNILNAEFLFVFEMKCCFSLHTHATASHEHFLIPTNNAMFVNDACKLCTKVSNILVQILLASFLYFSFWIFTSSITSSTWYVDLICYARRTLTRTKHAISFMAVEIDWTQRTSTHSLLFEEWNNIRRNAHSDKSLSSRRHNDIITLTHTA